MTKAHKVPLFLDCRWLSSAPDEKCTGVAKAPPEDETGVYNGLGGIKDFLVDRHGGAVNAVFADFSTQKVSLKQLWGLKWHKNYINKDSNKNDWLNKNANWPGWMNKCSGKGLR